MLFNPYDLVEIIAKKYDVTLPESDEWNIDEFLESGDISQGFLMDINSIVIPLVRGEVELDTNSRDEMYKIIPKEYLDQIKPVDENGKKLMSMSELRQSMRSNTIDIKSLNINESADQEREKFKAAYVHDDYPVYVGLEESWKLLEADYKVINREDHPSNNPLSSFSYYIDLGFYPPPEILMSVGNAISAYYNCGGEISLDQAFFGEKYKKTSSPAFLESKKMKYQFFEFSLNRMKEKNPSLSIEKIVSKMIEDEDPIIMRLFRLNPDMDVDSFLRGYRRWKKDIRDGEHEG